MLVLFTLVLLLERGSSQLFPFSTLRQYIDQKYAESITEEATTNPPPPVDTYRYLQETTQGTSSPSLTNVQELKREAVRTVFVTPRPKYVPQRLIPEPNLDPNNNRVPSIGFTLTSNPIKHEKLLSTSPPIIFNKQEIQLSNSQEIQIETVPSLSVTLHEGTNSKGLIDYLVPPKYPSVYENHKTTESINSLQKGSLKPKKKKKRKHNDSEQERSSSEKRGRIRRPKKKAQYPVLLKESYEPYHDYIESQPSATETYVYQQPQNHKFENEFPDSTLGLGKTGERVEFQLHGEGGPETYKFGFDTGDGKNRHFRYEEKNQRGHVKGHYGYYDKTGKLQIMNYLADEHGFHANPA